MRSSIINIGNSKGIRIPKLLLEESGIKKDVEISVKSGEIKIIPISDSSDSFASVSEASLAKDWLRPEEEEAWEDYQLDK